MLKWVITNNLSELFLYASLSHGIIFPFYLLKKPKAIWFHIIHSLIHAFT